MKKRLVFSYLIFSCLVAIAQAQVIGSEGKELKFPEVPRISAIEVYEKFKAGKVILVQAGGEAWERRHIIGAYNLPVEPIMYGKVEPPAFPRTGIEIITYCY